MLYYKSGKKIEVVKIEWRQKKPKILFDKHDHIHKKLARIYGIDDLQRFLHPTEDELFNPKLLKNIDLARDRILKAIHRNERISIFADVDNDGICSASIMFNYLRLHTDNVSYFCNQRSEGHGLANSLHLVPKNTNLLIVVDSSSNDTEQCKILKSKGIDIIILDHHVIEQQNPYCILVNPQACDYPNKSISGSVVAWKMCKELDEAFDINLSDDFVDLAAIGLLGDQMNILEYENRYIVQYGLRNIRNKGIKALISEFGKEKNKLSSTDVLFNIAPALNSACRLDRIEIALSLLTEEDPKKVKKLAREVIELNNERKIAQARYYNELVNQLNENDKCVVVINNSIGAGYRGLLAGDLFNKVKRPVMVLSESDDGTYKGSYRSGDYNLKAVLNSIPQVIYAAGHTNAGGVSFKKDDLIHVQKQLNDLLPSFNEKQKCLEYVLEFDIEEITEDLIRDIEEFYQINGNGFDIGLFKINNVFILDKQVLGRDRNTIKLGVCSAKIAKKHESWGYDSLDPSHYLMKFRTSTGYIGDECIHKEVSVLGTLNLNIYKNQRTGKLTKTKQIFIEDYKLIS